MQDANNPLIGLLWGVIFLVLWASFAGSLIAAGIGFRKISRGQRASGYTLVFAAVLVLLVFSFAGGFSIGRFTVAIPVVLTGAMLGTGRGWANLITWLVVAGVLYIMCSWVLQPVMLAGHLPWWLFGFWAIPFYCLVALVAFAVSVSVRPDRRAERA